VTAAASPLEALALYPAEPPSPEVVRASAPARGAVVRMMIWNAPVLPAWLADPTQPLTDDERQAAARAGSALILSCGDAPTLERLRSFADVLASLLALEGIAVVLPGAQRVVGRSRFGKGPWSAEELAAVFVHRHLVQTEAGIWCHTHGMEQLGLPDVECEVSRPSMVAAARLLDVAVAYLARHGPVLRAGETVAATDEQLDLRCQVAPGRTHEDHPWGTFGALRLDLVRSGPEKTDK
jgi:uncharacterized protein DUF4261